MAHMTKEDANDIAHRFNIPLGKNFHSLRSEQVEKVLAAADERKYVQPKNANGSRGRYFYAYLCRAARKND